MRYNTTRVVRRRSLAIRNLISALGNLRQGSLLRVTYGTHGTTVVSTSMHITGTVGSLTG